MVDGNTAPASAPPSAPADAAIPFRELVVAVAIIWAAEMVIGGVQGAFFAYNSTRYLPHAVLLATLAAAPVTLLVVWLFACRRRGMSISAGLSLRAPSRRVAVLSAAGGAGCALAAAAVMMRASTGRSLMDQLAATPFGLFAVGVLAFIAPFVEETYYRGMIFPALRKKIGAAAAAAIVALWFTIPHVPQLAADPVGIPIILAMGVVWTLQRHVHDSIAPSMISHWTYNMTLVGLTLFLR